MPATTFQNIYSASNTTQANRKGSNTDTCTKTNQSGIFNVGLPRYGEMFATQQAGGNVNSRAIWFINRFSESEAMELTTNAAFSAVEPTSNFAARPTLHLKSTVVIKSGSGTENDPYVVGLPDNS